MWLFLSDSFLSIVAVVDDPTSLLVRASGHDLTRQDRPISVVGLQRQSHFGLREYSLNVPTMLNR
jgi:hypothetical protein